MFKYSKSRLSSIIAVHRKAFLLLFSFLFIAQAKAQEIVRSAENMSVSIDAPDSIFLDLKKKHNQAVKQNDELNAGIYLQQMGEVCYVLGHYSQALDYHLQAGAIFQKLGNKKLQADNLNELGIIYYYSRQIQQSYKQYNDALALYQQLNDVNGIARTYGKIGHLYEKQHKYDSAFSYQRQALQQYQQATDKKGIAKIYENLGSIYEDLEHFDSAQYYFQHALSQYQSERDTLASIEVLNNLGDVLRKTGHYREGLEQTQKALNLSEKEHEKYQLTSAFRDMAKTYNLLGRNDSAYYYLELSRKNLQEIYSRESGKQVALLQVIYDIERKNHEIEKLQIERRTTIIITISVVIVIILVALLGMVVISRQRLKIRNERALSEQQIRNERALSEQNKKIFEAQRELMQVELTNKKLEEEQLTQALQLKNKELTTHTLHVIQKNQILEELKNKLEEMANDDKRDQKKQMKQLIQQINLNFNNEQYWQEFHNMFEQVHQSFFDNLKKHCNDLTANDLRLVALLRMNLSSDNMATLLGISQDSLRVSRYRLRKKLGLEQGENLTAFLQGL